MSKKYIRFGLFFSLLLIAYSNMLSMNIPPYLLPQNKTSHSGSISSSVTENHVSPLGLFAFGTAATIAHEIAVHQILKGYTPEYYKKRKESPLQTGLKEQFANKLLYFKGPLTTLSLLCIEKQFESTSYETTKQFCISFFSLLCGYTLFRLYKGYKKYTEVKKNLSTKNQIDVANETVESGQNILQLYDYYRFGCSLFNWAKTKLS